jgi:hypothetical protein
MQAGPAVPSANQPDAECIQRKVIFDGLEPLTYATVTEHGSTSNKSYLHHEYPSECSLNADCSAKAYLIPGDTVAVAKNCGPWSFVQFIGEKQVSYGWVRSEQLKASVSIPKRQESMSTSSAPMEPVFKLTKGHGTPVCEAYLQRLNQTEFTSPAYCGRPEDDRVPGFATLSRMPVINEDINRLSGLVTIIRRPLLVPDYKSMNENHGVFTGKPRSTGKLLGYITQSSWKYDQPLDIDNNGKPRQILIWNLDNPENPHCGGYEGRVPVLVRGGQIAFILTSDGQTIDQFASRESFGHPDGGYVIPPGLRPPGLTFLQAYRPIGNSYSVFEYRSLYYFDTFFDGDERLGDFQDGRRGNPSLADTLAVFQRTEDRTQQVCEYRVKE